MISFNLKIKAQQVDGDVVFTGVILHRTSQKGLSEEEAGHPEHAGFIGIIPIL